MYQMGSMDDIMGTKELSICKNTINWSTSNRRRIDYVIYNILWCKIKDITCWLWLITHYCKLENKWLSIDPEFSSHTKKCYLCEMMDVLITLILVIPHTTYVVIHILQYVCVSYHYIIYFKYTPLYLSTIFFLSWEKKSPVEASPLCKWTLSILHGRKKRHEAT